MDLHPTLYTFLCYEMAYVVQQTVKLNFALKLHQALMKEVCYSIKAHDHWIRYGGHFPFSIHCNLCGEAFPPEFDLGRHRGRCVLKHRTA